MKSIVGKESAKVGQGKAFASKWVKKDDKDKNLLRAATDNITDTTQEQLQEILKTKSHSDSRVLSDLKKRKLITPQKVIAFEVSKGPKYARELVIQETDLTADMLARYTLPHRWSDKYLQPQWSLEDGQVKTVCKLI